MPTFKTAQWIRVILSTLFGLALIAAVTYWQIQDKQIDVEEIAPGCIVRFSPDGSSEIIPFGDKRCPQ